MNKVYLGEIEVANTGGGGGGDYVTNASFSEMTRVAASALLDLKGITDNLEEVSDKNSKDVSIVRSEVTNKADVSTVYTKSEIDMADKVAAAAIASLDGRVSELEQESGGITPQQLDASLKEYTYDKAHIDASALAFDASIIALDASALAFDASIRELSQGGGGGSFDPTVINASVNALESVTDDISTLSNNIKNGTQILQRVIAAPDGLTKYHASKDSQKEVYNVVGQSPEDYYLDGTDAPIVFRVGASNIDAFRVKGYKSTDNLSRKIEYYDRFNDSMKDLAEMINYLDASALSFDVSIREIAQQGGGGGGGGITPAQLDASLKEYTYNKVYLDASFGAVDTSIVALDASALAFDASIREIAQQGGGGGGGGITPAQLDASLKEYTYNKGYLNASFGAVDTSIIALDASALAFDASIKELAQGGGGGGITPAQLDASLREYTYNKGYLDASFNACVSEDDISTFKPIVYTTKDEYDEDVSEGTIDPDTMYVITDIASTDELSNIVTIDDLNAEKARINASLNETGDAVITAANSSMNYWKTTNVSQCQSQCTTAKNNAVSAVQTQQTTSVNAVNTAKNTAISEIDTKMADMKSFEVMTEAEYAEITPDANTIYFITD